MVVVLIIGILVAIAIPIFNNASQTAKENTCKANIRTLNGAIVQYKAVKGEDPNNLDALASEFIKEVPKCPFGTAYALDGDYVAEHDHTPTTTP